MQIVAVVWVGDEGVVGRLLDVIVDKLKGGGGSLLQQPGPVQQVEVVRYLWRRRGRVLRHDNVRQEDGIKDKAQKARHLQNGLRAPVQPLNPRPYQLLYVGKVVCALHNGVEIVLPLVGSGAVVKIPLILQKAQELNDKETVALGLVKDNGREAFDNLHVAIDGVGDELVDTLEIQIL